MLELSFFKNKKIFITGHTGFKGSWLTFILYLCGAKITGYGLKPKHKFDNFYLLGLDKKIKNYYHDIRDKKKIRFALNKNKPQIIFHLAAQSLVKKSYVSPHYTFSTNIIGTLNILDELKNQKNLRSAVIITSDKCYKNKEKLIGYSETDELGGDDPYSASKAACENIFYSYYKSFYNSKSKFGLASVRAGNVIGGGDWSEDRIIPDFIRAIWKKKKFVIRSPHATRPWQHVFDLLSGYLLLSKNLYYNQKFSGSWNFGPTKKKITVKEIIESLKEEMNSNKKIYFKANKLIKETNFLSLKSKKSNSLLKWHPKLSIKKSISLTGKWYFNFLNKKNMQTISKEQIKEFFYD